MSRADFRFSRRDVREATQWSDTPLKVHLGRLAEMEYLLVHRGGRGQSFAYELLYQGEGEEGAPFVMGLIDVERLRYDGNRSGENGARSGVGQPRVSPRSGGGPGAGNGGSARHNNHLAENAPAEAENALLRPTRGHASYPSHTAAPGD
jgi:hypothetical protein